MHSSTGQEDHNSLDSVFTNPAPKNTPLVKLAVKPDVCPISPENTLK